MKKINIAIDFDGVIHRYSKNWHDGSLYDPPVDGAAQALSLLQKAGYYIIIFSARNYNRVERDGKYQKNQVDDIKTYLNHYKIPYDSIWTKCGKPPVKIFIDDKGYRFEGDWQKTVLDVQKLVPIK